MTRSALFDAVRPFAPDRRFAPGDVAAIDSLADRWGLDRLTKVETRLNDPAAFFAHLRNGKLLGPALSADEVSGCTAITDACGRDGWPVGFTAYALATAYHETAGTMQPIHELGGPTYLKRMYDIEGARPAKARELGNLSPGDGARYAGRGYVQLTGRTNYTKAAHVVGADLVGTPDLAMRPSIAAAIMVTGMRDGWFTSRKLSDDIPTDRAASLTEFARSRDIINGTDKADKIAAEAVEFQAALTVGGWA